jgi:ArsR family transcriptional regulator
MAVVAMAIGGSGDSITLDRTAFKALASETRVEILKQLDASQKTVSDLARDMSMNKATMFQHLEQLVDAGLVKKDSEEDRATTVKGGPLDAPVAGPPKKWVYYRLTGKGRTLLHPERVKIAIMLGVTVISCLVLLAVYGMMLTSGPAQSGALTEKDWSAPDIISWSVDEVGPSTKSVGVRVEVADNATGKVVSGIDPDSIVVRWGVGSSPTSNDPDILSWQTVTATVTSGQIHAVIPESGWASYGARYLYISLEMRDLSGNSATYIHHKRINVAGAADLAISQTDITFQNSSSYNVATVIVTVHNYGSENATNVTVGVYLENPDPAGTGISVVSVPLERVVVDRIRANTTTTVTFTMSSSKLANGFVYVMVDPDNKVIETGKDNNVARVTVPNYVLKGGRPAAEKSMGAPGFELVGALGAIVVVSMVISRRRNRD